MLLELMLCMVLERSIVSGAVVLIVIGMIGLVVVMGLVLKVVFKNRRARGRVLIAKFRIQATVLCHLRVRRFLEHVVFMACLAPQVLSEFLWSDWLVGKLTISLILCRVEFFSLNL